MKNFIIQNKPFIVPTTDGKLIEEHFGKGSIETGDYSFAHMVAPPGWSEPFQTPDFDEITYIISGQKKFEFEDEEVILSAGKSIFVGKGTKIKYSNPFDKPCEYIAICIPAFTLERAKREN